MSEIIIRGARLHNLKAVSLSIPKNALVVFTGVSGSGKSTLAFDTLHKEGQRQYMESLGMVTYESRPPVDAIIGLSPSISVDQRNTNRSPRSTVGTATEVYTYLRVLFARLGHRPCPGCGKDVPSPYDDTPIDWASDSPTSDSAVDPVETSVACPHCGAPLPELGMASFSFNKPAGACPICTGLGTVQHANLERLVNEELSILEGAVHGCDPLLRQYHADTMRAAGRHYGFDFDPALPVRLFSPPQRDLLLYGVASPQFRRHFPQVEPPGTAKAGRFEGVATALLRRYAERIEDTDYLEKLGDLVITETCTGCDGTRLRPESRSVTVVGRTIVAIARLSLTQVAEWLDGLPAALSEKEMLIARPILDDLHERVRRLVDVGLGYLTLDRATPSLAAGEAQRLRLAALLGSGLTGVLYILDEPTIGLHARDTQRLVTMLRALRDLGNTVLVIEHDMDVIAAADWVVDFGPGGGQLGGRIMAQGAPGTVSLTQASITGQYLSGTARIPIPASRRPVTDSGLTIRGAREHNLKDITTFFPGRTLTAVTGVSGSGKSSLLFDILDRAARRRYYGAAELPGAHDRIDGWEHFDKVITIDQGPIGRSTRSNAATYTDAFTAIRDAFAAQPAAREHSLTAQHFSFNVPGGRCDRCEGAGVLAVEMHFLPDVEVRCPACHGRRFKHEVLTVTYRGYNIAQVLDLTIEEALSLFADISAARARLGLMVETGMGYLQLGQPASTFSGGEAQRVKLAKELARRSTGRTLYLLDEPTTGLHPADTAHLVLLLQRLVDAGNTVIVVEHNLDVVKCADWVIDLGPEGGEAGGRLIAAGTPEAVAACPASITGRMLKRLL
ncbi:MAG: excinuclease ABC subunit UvrA [Anaerolineae bacterium]|jgi:excinuclease ABC subunit A|nr:excinuclease ABC subunit UvrA [Anaerolineae bacterium]